MNPAHDCIAIIPCRNEASAIAGVVSAVRRHTRAALVVDDGSRDHTADLAAKAGAETLRFDQTRGKGAALRAGLSAAFNRGFQRAITLDGDGQHLASHIPRFLREIRPGRPRLIIGDRMSKSGNMPFCRRMTNAALSRTLSLAAGHPLPDTQSGFRLLELDRGFLDRLSANHFETESDQIAVALELGWEIVFIPTACVYRRENSSIRPIVDGARWLKWALGKRRALAAVRRRRAGDARPKPAHFAVNA